MGPNECGSQPSEEDEDSSVGSGFAFLIFLRLVTGGLKSESSEEDDECLIFFNLFDSPLLLSPP